MQEELKTANRLKIRYKQDYFHQLISMLQGLKQDAIRVSIVEGRCFLKRRPFELKQFKHLFHCIINLLKSQLITFCLRTILMLTPENTVKSIEISSSESESDQFQSSVSSNQDGFDFPSKKKRIVRKKYKPRKKDVFIHTICVLNKNNFRAQNSIIETFLIPEGQQGAKLNKKSVQSTIEKTNEQYLRKLKENIKFTQSLNEKKQVPMSLPFNMGQLQTSLAIENGILREEPQLKWLQRAPTSYMAPLLSEYIRINRGVGLFK